MYNSTSGPERSLGDELPRVSAEETLAEREVPAHQVHHGTCTATVLSCTCTATLRKPSCTRVSVHVATISACTAHLHLYCDTLKYIVALKTDYYIAESMYRCCGLEPIHMDSDTLVS